jgi:type IV secretory pathway VirB3-like protein
VSRSGRAGEFPIFKGAHRAKLIKGIDQRVCALAVVLVLFGIFNPLLLWPAAALVLFLGRIAGAKSPYFFDELSVFITWRFMNWHNVMPDDGYYTSADAGFRKKFRKAKT